MVLSHSTTPGVLTGCGNPLGKVVQAIRCLQQHDVPVNAMVVVSRQSASQGSLYRCLSREAKPSTISSLFPPR